MAAGLQVNGLDFRYGGASQAALHGMDLTVEPGEVLSVVGPSGSGKSTLLRLLCGLLTPTAGTVAIGGTDVTALPPERRPVAMVFQGFALFPHLTVHDNIGFGMRVRRVSRAERDTRVRQVAEVLHLDGLLARLPAELSGGERQRTALARALVRDPVVFCLDEPLSSLDPVLRTEARRELDQVLRSDGRCAVYVTHDQSEAMTVGDRVAVLRHGRLEQLAAPRDLYAGPATAFVASFVGSPPMSLLRTRGGAVGPLDPGWPVPEGYTLGVRAEDVLLGRGNATLRVRGLEDYGHEVHVLLDVAGQHLVARVAAGAVPPVGSAVPVQIDPTRVRVFDPEGRFVARPR